MPASLGWLLVMTGQLAIFATYWDEAFHTDVGRDKAWSAPHLLLYGSVAVVGLGVAYWGIRQLLATHSLSQSVRNLPVAAAGLGALGALIAAPIDIAWHETYGRDAVLWSPPHMLVLLGSIALGLGVTAGIPAGNRALRVGAGVLLLANAVAVVFEYEADVPQFREGLYLPILIGVSLAVALVVDQLLGRAWVAAVTLGYAATRLAIAGGLAALGRSTPDLPIAILGLALWSLPLKSRVQRATAAAGGIAALAMLSSAFGAASQPTDSVTATGAPVLLIALLVLARRRRHLAAAVLLAGAAFMTLAPQDPAAAHDPGQGDPVVPVELTGHGGGGVLGITATVTEHCDDLQPVRVVVRRAGRTLTAPLTAAASCSFHGQITVPTDGRWFTYVEFRHERQLLEAWLPLDPSSAIDITQPRHLYLPAGSGREATPTQVLLGGLIYLLGFALIGLGIAAVRQARRDAVRVAS